MTRTAKTGILIIALSICAAFGGLAALKHDHLLSDTYRYRITVEVETPQGVRSGFAVREITYSRQWLKLPDMAGVVASQRGEAVAVDLPGGQTLFALLSVNGYDTLQAAFGDDAPATLDAAKADGRIVELRPKPGAIREQSGYPLLVRFRDIRDPKSVEPVEPDDLSDKFGDGYELRRITLQMTDDLITAEIENLLPKSDSRGFYNWDHKSNQNLLGTYGIWNFVKRK